MSARSLGSVWGTFCLDLEVAIDTAEGGALWRALWTRSQADVR